MKLRLPFSTRDSTLENPSADLVSAIMSELDGGSPLGVTKLSPLQSMRLTAVNACVRVLAETAGSLPLPIYRREGRSRIRVNEDPRDWLLNDQPNPEMYAMELHETILGSANLWGKGFTYIVRNNAGMPTELWPIRSDRTDRFRTDSGKIAYKTQIDSGEWVPIPGEDVYEVKAIFGLSPIRTAQPTISSAASAEDFGGHFWANSARPGGVIEVDHRMEEDEYQEFKRRWNAGHQGLSRSQLVGILTNASWKEVGVAPQLAQFVEQRMFSVREIARLFRVPPHMIADLDGTVTRASIEQQAIEFVIYSLRPWLVRYEQAVKRGVFNLKADRKAGLYPEVLVDGLLRGDTAARNEAYSRGIQFGWLSRADVRELENLSEVEGLDEFLVPVNMMSSNALQQTPPPDAASLASLALMLRDEPEISEKLARLALEAVKNGNGNGHAELVPSE